MCHRRPMGDFSIWQCSYTFVHLTSARRPRGPSCAALATQPVSSPLLSRRPRPSVAAPFSMYTVIESKWISVGGGEWRSGWAWQKFTGPLGWLIILLNRKKGSSAIILPAYDVLSFVCHSHCDIRGPEGAALRRWGPRPPSVDKMCLNGARIFAFAGRRGLRARRELTSNYSATECFSMIGLAAVGGVWN